MIVEKHMRADQMQRATKAIVALLKNSDILNIVRQCRTPADDQKHARLAKLGHASAVLMESTESLDPSARTVLKALHLESLTSPGYWRGLLAETADEKSRQAEFVRLYSRVLFATNHLPSLMSLLSSSSDVFETTAVDGEQIMTVKLNDAGEKASDPDRLARVIDGIDMLYSACATLAKKPAMDLQLVSVTGKGAERDIAFLGDVEAIQAVKTIIESIPDAIADIDPDEDIDIQFLVQSLPVFDDLKILQKLGTYTPSDLQDIRDTMHQGVLLSLESGAVLRYSEEEKREYASAQSQKAERTRSNPKSVVKAVPVLHNSARSNATQSSQPGHASQAMSSEQRTASAVGDSDQAEQQQHSVGSASLDKDEYYDQYLRERERLQSGVETSPQPMVSESDDKRGNAIDNLLRSLKK